ncbi:MAG: hypothetical protein EA427_08700 [Spirochaetaceae bacterium]|nr:MAG: hypothetical protein EA427_08700 [Spirochaetaceae bacterium]
MTRSITVILTLVLAAAGIFGVIAPVTAQGGPPPGAGPSPPQFSLVSVSSTVVVDNQIFSPASGSIGVTVGHTGGPGGYVVTVSRGSSPTFDPRTMVRQGFFGVLLPRLEYNIFTPADEIARDLTVPLTNNQVIRGSFGNSGSAFNTESRSFTVRIPEEQFVRRGTYQDQVEVSLYQGRQVDPDTLVLIDRATVTISSTTPTIAQIAISGQSSYTMDFGNLVPGATRSAPLQYRTNTGFRIDAESENGGVLVNQTHSGSAPIPYQLAVGGNTVDLSDSALVGLDLLFGTTIEFESLPMSVTIGSFEDVLPGLFQDVITFTISNF